MKKFKLIIPVVLIIMLIPYITGCMHDDSEIPEVTVIKSSSDIDKVEIEIAYQLFGEYDKYIVDFSSNTFTHQNTDEEKVSHFSDEEKEYFVDKANMCGFFNWKESYESPEENMCGGSYEEFIIKYVDGSEQEIYCSYAYPDTFYQFLGAFFEIFGDFTIQEDDYENTT